MGATNGLPWPDGSGKLIDGDDAIHALADAVDTRVPWRMTANLSTWTAPGPNAGVSAGLTFPVGRFTAVPVVVVTADSTGYLAGSSGGVTTAGFTGRVYNPTAGAPTGVFLRWIAVQFLPGAGPGLAAPLTGELRTIVATCHTEGCPNAGAGIELTVYADEVLDFVACGVCGQPIEDVVW